MSVKVFPSLSGILLLLQKGFVWEDNSDCLYMFGCTKLGIDQTFEHYRGIDKAAFLAKLEKADSEGRVNWRQKGDCTIGATNRMEWFIGQIQSRNVPVTLDMSYNSGYYDAGWNLPALSRWIEANAPSVTVLDGRS